MFQSGEEMNCDRLPLTARIIAVAAYLCIALHYAAQVVSGNPIGQVVTVFVALVVTVICLAYYAMFRRDEIIRVRREIDEYFSQKR